MIHNFAFFMNSFQYACQYRDVDIVQMLIDRNVNLMQANLLDRNTPVISVSVPLPHFIIITIEQTFKLLRKLQNFWGYSYLLYLCWAKLMLMLITQGWNPLNIIKVYTSLYKISNELLRNRKKPWKFCGFLNKDTVRVLKVAASITGQVWIFVKKTIQFVKIFP